MFFDPLGTKTTDPKAGARYRPLPRRSLLRAICYLPFITPLLLPGLLWLAELISKEVGFQENEICRDVFSFVVIVGVLAGWVKLRGIVFIAVWSVFICVYLETTRHAGLEAAKPQ